MHGEPEQWVCFRVGEDLARQLTGSSSPASLPYGLEELEALGLAVEPLRPGLEHPAFHLWFKARLSEEVDGVELLHRLLDGDAVHSGYLTSRPPPPGLLTEGWVI